MKCVSSTCSELKKKNALGVKSCRYKFNDTVLTMRLCAMNKCVFQLNCKRVPQKHSEHA